MQHKVNRVLYRQQPGQHAVTPAVGSTSKRALTTDLGFKALRS